MGLELSVVIPCLDEERTIGGCVREALSAMDRAGVRGEVVVADNGSTDRSANVAEAEGAQVVRCPVRGYGAALRAGFAAARGRFVLMGDADGSYDFGELARFLAPLRKGAPFVIGTRLRGTIEPGAMAALHRHLGTPVLTFLINCLYGTRITDSNCGMRGLDRRVLPLVLGDSTGMEFAAEMIILAALHQVPLTEVPITLRRDGRGRAPHLRTWPDGWRNLRTIVSLVEDLTRLSLLAPLRILMGGQGVRRCGRQS